jgi:thiamine biosynthesis protein ThiI
MNFVALISSGIDSPVATYLFSEIADEIILVHSENDPYINKKENDKFIKLAKHLNNIMKCKIKIYIIPHGISLLTYKNNCDNKYTCVFCKRTLVRYAEKIALKENADAIIMGDSLGQVASQTLKNLKVVEEATSLPILRPLIGMDKNDVIKIARNIGSYDLSIFPSFSCDAVPYKPSTQAKIEKLKNEEKKIDVDRLIIQAIENAKLIEL